MLHIFVTQVTEKQQQINALRQEENFQTEMFFLWPQGSNLNRFFPTSSHILSFGCLTRKTQFSARWEDIYVAGNLSNIASKIIRKSFHNLICIPSVLYGRKVDDIQ